MSTQVSGAACIIRAMSMSWKQPFSCMMIFPPRLSSAGVPYTTILYGLSPASSLMQGRLDDGRPLHLMATAVSHGEGVIFCQQAEGRAALSLFITTPRKAVSIPPTPCST